MMPKRIIAFENSAIFQEWRQGEGQLLQYQCVDLATEVHHFIEDKRKAFINNYIDVVGQLSVINHSRRWWATDISSKNRFFSPLPRVLQQYVQVLDAVTQCQDNILVFINVPWELEGQLHADAILRQQDYCWYGNRISILAQGINQWILRVARVMKHAFQAFSKINQCRWVLGNKLAHQNEDTYLIKTFIAKRSFDSRGNYNDIFFGQLPSFIKSRQPLMILADVLDDYNATLKLIKKNAHTWIVPVEALLTISDLIKATVQLSSYQIIINDGIMFDGHNISPLLRRICWLNGSKIQPHQYYHYFAMRRLLTRQNISGFAYTCEFNPWEKMCLIAIKELVPYVSTYGYQHTVVPQASMNMFTSRFEESLMPRPNKILTVGDEPRAIIHEYETCKPSAIESACGLRFAYLFNSNQQSQLNRRGNILLALEGLPQVVEMVSSVLNQIGNDRQYNLCIRTHPVLPFAAFKDQLSVDANVLDKVRLSEGKVSLTEDLQWADIVVYWGTTVSLEALALGKPVVHFDNGSMVSYDPLFKLTALKWSVTAQDDLKAVLNTIYQLTDQQYAVQLNQVKVYLSRYFSPITEQSLSLFMR